MTVYTNQKKWRYTRMENSYSPSTLQLKNMSCMHDLRNSIT